MDGSLALWPVKIAMLIERSQPSREIPLSAGVQGKNLWGVEETKLGHIVEERDVAGLKFEGVGDLRTFKFFKAWSRHKRPVIIIIRLTTPSFEAFSPVFPFFRQFTPPHRRAKRNRRRERRPSHQTWPRDISRSDDQRGGAE